jgi:methylated-DNA-[protein]-cysteine S-methyltransferase
MIKAFHPSPIGDLTILSDGAALAALLFAEHGKPLAALAGAVAGEDAVIRAARAQISDYFAGARAAFDLPLAPRGTPFQQAVWRALGALGYGATASYAGIAAAIGAPKAVRAVGGAIGANPIGIIIPCHRVIGASGALTGFAGGLARKRFLLAHESGAAAPAGAVPARAAS